MTIETQPVVRHWTLNLPLRLRLLWGAVGLVFGIALTLFVLIWLAPQPPALHSPAPAPTTSLSRSTTPTSRRSWPIR